MLHVACLYHALNKCELCVNQTKEEMVGTVDAVQALQVQNGHLQKSKEGYHTKCLELDRLRKEGAPQKELEKVCCYFEIYFSAICHRSEQTKIKNSAK